MKTFRELHGKVICLAVLIWNCGLSPAQGMYPGQTRHNFKKQEDTGYSYGKEFSKLEKASLLAIGEINKLFRQESEPIWPGFDLSKQPFLVYIPEKWVLLVNSNRTMPGFSSYPEDWPDIHTDAMIYYGNYEGLMGQLQFDFKMDSLVTVAVGLPEGFLPVDSSDIMIRVFSFIIHEAFHQFQRQNFGDIPWVREERYPILDPENTASAYLEMQILKDALIAMNGQQSAPCRDLCRHFAAVRENRWKTANPLVKEYEQGQEINEGTAKYVEVRSILDMNQLAGNPDQNIHPDFLSVFNTQERALAYLYQNFNQIMADKTVQPDDMIRNRIYPVGAAEGLLLDYLGIEWKNDAQKAGPDFTFSGKFISALCNNTDNTETMVVNAREKHHYDKVKSTTQGKIEDYLDQYEKVLSSFNAQEGYRIEVHFNYSSLSRSQSTLEKKWVIKNGEELLCMNNRIFKLKTENILITIENKAVLQHQYWDNKQAEIVFYLENPESISIDSLEYPVSEIPEMQFSELTIRGKDIELSYKSPGQIKRSGNTISIVEQ